MTLHELQEWILSPEGLLDELSLLARFSAAKSMDLRALSAEISDLHPNWKRLLFAGSILAKSDSGRLNEIALMIAHSGILYSNDKCIADASGTLLAQLSNHRALTLANEREALRPQLEDRVGIAEHILFVRRELTQSIFLAKGEVIKANRFQRQLWDDLDVSGWTSASAPTASGKTYLVLRWLLNEFAADRTRLAVFIAPTRALVGEIEHQLIELNSVQGIEGLRIASLPLAELGDLSRPTILVFTQERLHIFLNSMNAIANIDIVVVDEIQKLGDRLRGVILQDAIERVVRGNAAVRLVFLSPLTENPEEMLIGAPPATRTASVPSEIPTVSQNLIIAAQLPRHPDRWQLHLQREGSSSELGEISLHSRPDTQIKRLSYVALALGRYNSGTLIYANGAAEASKIAWQIYNGLDDEYPQASSADEQLNELADFTKDTVHPEYQLVSLVKRGVAFHYGNMPTLLRSEIERLFRDGKIRFLVCTSTLIEGVNLACRTIFIRGPRKGNGNKMGPHDFWNLAGRAGRWGRDFHGNIVCIDVNRPDLWPNGVPAKARYPIKRETETVLARREAMLEYLRVRRDLETSKIVPDLEQVLAYLLVWKSREGTILTCPAANRLGADYAQELEVAISALFVGIEFPTNTIVKHPGVSAVALQSLLKYFRGRRKPIEDLIPSSPDSDDAHARLIGAFTRINDHMFPAFIPKGFIPVYALITLEWMKGMPLGQIIRRRIKYMEDHDRPFELQALIRDTMRDVEDAARFKAPKYLAAYLDVLKLHLEQQGRADLFPSDLRFDLYLEFGVGTKTLLSLIGLGLSRTAAVALNEFLADVALTENEILTKLALREWTRYDMPAVIKREIDHMLTRRLQQIA